jgi:hypothetical protein
MAQEVEVDRIDEHTRSRRVTTDHGQCDLSGCPGVQACEIELAGGKEAFETNATFAEDRDPA